MEEITYLVTGPAHHPASRNLTTGDKIYLEKEPDNAYDPNAIAVFNNNREKVGYLPRDHAATWKDVKPTMVSCLLCKFLRWGSNKTTFEISAMKPCME